jgi:hypothetical protein
VRLLMRPTMSDEDIDEVVRGVRKVAEYFIAHPQED